MDKELQNLLDNYENAIYGQAFPIIPSIHQLHLLLDYIANLEQQCKKQKEVINKINDFCKDDKNFEILDLYSQDIVDEMQAKLLDILKENLNEKI